MAASKKNLMKDAYWAWAAELQGAHRSPEEVFLAGSELQKKLIILSIQAGIENLKKQNYSDPLDDAMNERAWMTMQTIINVLEKDC